jgi:hypothetical protein
MIFVFGSNEAGLHDGGAAAFAMKHHGAVYGAGVGPYGNSFALPTMDSNFNVLPVWKINHYVTNFLTYSKYNPELNFMLTNIGCGIADYSPEQIAPLFRTITDNVFVSPDFGRIIYANL